MSNDSDFSMRYWDYFCALEEDLKKVSRYIEFTEDNLNTHSIELTHLLLSSCSEIDVILKEICNILDKKLKPTKINEYRKIIIKCLPDLINEKINIGFSFSIEPWEEWNKKSNLEWWKSHNNVKHKRNEFYYQANLDNTMKSISALFICVNYYFKLVLSEPLKKKLNRELEFQDITRLLKSRTNFIRFQADYYDKHLLI